MRVFLISHIFRPWHFEQRTKTITEGINNIVLLYYLHNSPFEYLNYFHVTCQFAGKPLHIELCILQVGNALVLHILDVLLVLFIWTFRKNLCTFFSVTL